MNSNQPCQESPQLAHLLDYIYRPKSGYGLGSLAAALGRSSSADEATTPSSSRLPPGWGLVAIGTDK